MSRKFARALAALSILFAVNSHAGPGELDLAFGSGGIARISAALTSTTTILSTAKQVDGKVLVAGVTQASTTSPQQPAIGRFNPDGALDTSFGDGGWFIPDIRGYANEASAITVSSAADGHVLVGLAPRDPGALPAVMRLTPDGAPDPAFPSTTGNGNGIEWLFPLQQQAIVAIAELRGGGILVAASSTFGGSPAIYALDSFGNLNFGFGQGGQAFVSLGDGASAIQAVRVGSDGAIFVSGWTDPFGENDFVNRDMAVAKLTPNGMPDSQFGANGRVTVDFAGGDDEGRVIAIDGQGRIIVAGKAGWPFLFEGQSGMGVARLDPGSGVLDSTFGNGGKAQLDVASSQNDVALATAVEFSTTGDGSMLVGGYATSAPSNGNPTTASILARIDATGIPVASFGNGGVVSGPRSFDQVPTGDILTGLAATGGAVVAFGTRNVLTDATQPFGPLRAFALRQQFAESDGSLAGDTLTGQALHTVATVSSRAVTRADGSFLTIGTSGESARVTRLLATGSLDAGFANAGRLEFQVASASTSGRAIAADAAGNVLAASLVADPSVPGTRRGSVTRWTPGGLLDPFYGNGDASVGPMDDIVGIAVQADGKAVIAGRSGGHLVVARLDASGAVDASFNGGTVAIPSPADHADALALQADGTIFVAGHISFDEFTSLAIVARLANDGSLDANWGDSGVASIGNDQGGTLVIDAMAPQSDGKVLLGGTSISPRHDFRPAAMVARLSAIGQRDASFGFEGFVDDGNAPPSSHITGLGATRDGKVVAGGDYGSGIPFAMRFTADGVLDTQYGVAGRAETSQVQSDDWVASIIDDTGAMRLMGYSSLASNDEDVLFVQFQGQSVFDQPDAFRLADALDVPVSQLITSAPVNITGINVLVPISISGGEYSVGCSGTFTNQPGMASNGEALCVRVLSSDLGNQSTQAQLTVASFSTFFTVTTGILPDTSIAPGPPVVASTSASFTFASSDASATFRCSLDGAAFSACTSPLVLTGLIEGDHVLSVAAVNRIGADASPAQSVWRIDVTPPETTIVSGPSGKKNPDDATFEFVSSEAASTFECRLDGGAFAPCASPTTYENLEKGWHTFDVRARDAAGNLDNSPASVTWRSKKK